MGSLQKAETTPEMGAWPFPPSGREWYGMRLSRAGMEHSPTSATGTAWEPTPWRATQRAVWVALDRSEEGDR
jgi:hypothetical protein